MRQAGCCASQLLASDCQHGHGSSQPFSRNSELEPLAAGPAPRRRVFGSDIRGLLRVESLWKTRKAPMPLDLDAILAEEGAAAANSGSSSSGGAVGQQANGGAAGARGSSWPAAERALQGLLENALVTARGSNNEPSNCTMHTHRSAALCAGSGGGSAAAALGLGDAHAVWSLGQNARVFLEAVRHFHEERAGEIGSVQVGGRPCGGQPRALLCSWAALLREGLQFIAVAAALAGPLEE